MTQPHSNVDKTIYGSGHRSVIQRTVADSRLTHKHDLVPIATPPAVDPKVSDNRPNQTSNKYYANYVPKTKPAAISSLGMVKLNVSAQAPIVANGVQTVLVDASNLREQMQNVIDLLQQGYPAVQVALAHITLQLAARTQLDLAVSREEITEDQARDVKFGIANAGLAEAKVVDMLEAEPHKAVEPPTLTVTIPEAVDPTEEQLEDAEPFTGDPAAFVRGDTEATAEPEAETVASADHKTAEEDQGD